MSRIASIEDFESRRATIGVVGLGYVGRPLAVCLAKRYAVIGVDSDPIRIKALQTEIESRGEVSQEMLRGSSANFSANFEPISSCRLVVVTVPTPIDEDKRPNLGSLISASRMIGRHLSRGTVIVYESTVYPGVTEDQCVPILEEESGLRWKSDFWVGYSPERINPGDRQHGIENIVKVVAGDVEETAGLLALIYGKAIPAGVHVASSIKIAEAAKVIENTQRDLNIALMNEVAIICGQLGISTRDVLEAARTKWNFVDFRPGLVGGNCVAVDPFYLTHIAERVGHRPQVILAGRRINDGMGKYVAEQTIKQLARARKVLAECRVLILGITFKENIPDVRNTRVTDIVNELQVYGIEAVVHDPHAAPKEVYGNYGIKLLNTEKEAAPYDAIIVAVRHDAYRSLDLDWVASVSRTQPILIDVQWVFDLNETKKRDFIHWQL